MRRTGVPCATSGSFPSWKFATSALYTAIAKSTNSLRSLSVALRKILPVILLSRANLAISSATRDGNDNVSPDRTRKAVVRYEDNCAGVHDFGFKGKSSREGATDIGFPLETGRVSARFSLLGDGRSDSASAECILSASFLVNPGGIGRGPGISSDSDPLYRFPRPGFVGLGLGDGGT